MNNIINQTPYLPTARNFPVEAEELVIEIGRSYIDIANCVNNRTISIFPTNRPAINGESWFIGNKRHQAFRQIYTFTTTANIPHNVFSIYSFTKCEGVFTDGTNWYGCIFGSNTAIAGQLSFYITPSVGKTSGNIVFQTGAGAPAIQSGMIILEWISQV